MKKTDIFKTVFFKNVKIFRHTPKTGKPASIPGTIDYFGTKGDRPIKLDLFLYDQDDYTENNYIQVDDINKFLHAQKVCWLNVSGVHDVSVIEKIGMQFDIHPLVLEDIANTTNRPKFEDYDDYIYLVLKMIYFEPDLKEVIIEQVSVVLKNNFVIVFQENGLDVFDSLRDRIRNNVGRMRKMGSDYLMYCIIDAVVDHYFLVLEKIGEEIENLEEFLMNTPDRHILNKIYRLKQELVFLRKSIWPTRELVGKLQRIGHKLIADSTWLFFRDLYDHTVQVMETVETFRDMVSGMLELYLTTTSNKMNEVMKVLTIFAAIFIPLTFLAGVYGMNFKFMPELKWRYSYFVWWGFSIIISFGMIVYFKKKKWL